MGNAVHCPVFVEGGDDEIAGRQRRRRRCRLRAIGCGRRRRLSRRSCSQCEGVSLTGEGLRSLPMCTVRQVLQTGLDVETADHLGYEPDESLRRGSGNSRNGAYPKTVRTDVGPVELRMPRDRQAPSSPSRYQTCAPPGGAGRERGQPLRVRADHGRDPGPSC